MTIQEFRRAAAGKIFTVKFIKKDGSLRTMNARLGVKSHLHGGELPYDAESYNLLPVYDIQSKGYRMINFSTIKEITMNNRTMTF